jgi:hypothetical protein
MELKANMMRMFTMKAISLFGDHTGTYSSDGAIDAALTI